MNSSRNFCRWAPVLVALASLVLCGRVAGQQGTAKTPLPYKEDQSELTVVAAKVQMLLIAPGGKKTGYDPKSRKVVRGIPNSAYYQDALLQYDSGRVDPNTTQTIDLKRPQAGPFRLVVSPGTAADGEEYEIHVNLYLQGGGEARMARIAGTMEAGRSTVYELSVSAEPPGVVASKQPSRSVR
jgi:hypothetical protein